MLGKPLGAAQLREYSGGIGPVDTMINYTPEQVYQVFDQLGEIGRSAYFRFILLDLVYILIYVSFFLVGINLFLRQLLPGKPPLHWIKLTPVLAGFADLGEGIGLLAILSSYPGRLLGVAQVMNAFTLVKFTLFSLSTLFLFILIIWWAWDRVSKRKRLK